MADVTNDRGQLILVGGLVVAFALVALILLLNAALFAENVATRGLGPGPDRAGDHVAFADRAGDRVLRHEERIEYEGWANAEANATRNVERIDAAIRSRQFQQHSALASVTKDRLQRGAALVQTNASRNFTAGGTNNGTDDWNLTSTDGIRNFTMTVDARETASKPASRNFTVNITGSSTWSAEVYSVTDGGNEVVEVHTTGTTCTSSSNVSRINWTAGTLAGCSFPFAVNPSGGSIDGPYTIRFQNGTNATGKYHLVVRNNSTNDDIETENFGAANTTTNPRQYAAVYSAVLQLRYEESTTDYETHVRVAPGEPEQTRPTP